MHSLLQAVEREPQPESVEKAWAQGIAFYFHVRMVRFLLKRPDLYIGHWEQLQSVLARLQHPLLRQRRLSHIHIRFCIVASTGCMFKGHRVCMDCSRATLRMRAFMVVV